MYKIKKHLNYILTPILFIINIFLFGFFKQKIFFLLIIFYISSIFKTNKITPLIITLLFISLNSLILHDQFGLSLIYLIPISIIGLESKNYLNDAFWMPYLALFLIIIIQEPFTHFTLFKIAINLLLLAFFEKYLSQR